MFLTNELSAFILNKIGYILYSEVIRLMIFKKPLNIKVYGG